MLNTQHRGWKGRRKTTQGYIWIYEPEAFGCKTTKGLDGYIREHNLVIERFLGRSLENSEVIHHTSLKGDNRLCKLMLFKTGTSHRMFEVQKTKLVYAEEVIFDGRPLEKFCKLCNWCKEWEAYLEERKVKYNCK